MFVATAISASSSSLINNSNLVTKVYFPRLVLPLAAIGASMLDFSLGLISLTIVMIIYGVTTSWTILLAPVFLLLCLIITTSLGIIISAINVRYRDVKYVLPVLLQFWLFVTPIFYSLEMIPEESRWIWKLNPMTGTVNGFRYALFGAGLDPFEIAVSVVTAVVLSILAVRVFYRMEDTFADVI
jgi:lipopolysaccharide transport system permease protein